MKAADEALRPPCADAARKYERADDAPEAEAGDSRAADDDEDANDDEDDEPIGRRGRRACDADEARSGDAARALCKRSCFWGCVKHNVEQKAKTHGDHERNIEAYKSMQTG